MLPSTLTFQEKLFIRRRRDGLTQAQMASLLGISYAKFRCWTRGQFAKRDVLPEIDLGPRLSTTEICVILRKRSKKKQWQIARDLGITTALVNMMEKNKVDSLRLFTYWGLHRNGEKNQGNTTSEQPSRNWLSKAMEARRPLGINSNND